MERVLFRGMSPRELQTRVATSLVAGYFSSPFGKVLFTWSGSALCGLYFGEIEGMEGVPMDPLGAQEWGEKVFYSAEPIEVWASGTTFSLCVWEALLTIPKGKVVGYLDIAEKIGKRKGVRAVASAIGRNPISYLIPCHRVIRSDGSMGGYRFGLKIKRALLKEEKCVKFS